MLSAKGITCVKSDRVLFTDVSLNVNPGDVLYVTGENGTGKTSLLRILVGLSSPMAGQVKIQDIDVHQDTARATVALVYCGHKSGVSMNLSAIENLIFWCQQRQLNPSLKDIYAVLNDLELTGLEDIHVRHLSAGQQRRVSLAKLWLHNKARIWILDEPFTALDMYGIALVEQKIDSFTANGGAVIVTSHQVLNVNTTVTTLQLSNDN